MKRLRSLRVRFAVWTAGLLLAVLSAFGAYIYSSVANGLFAALDTDLALSAARVIDGLDVQATGIYALSEHFMQLPENAAWIKPGFTIQIRSLHGVVLQTLGRYPTASASPDVLASHAAFATVRDPESGSEPRVYSTHAIENGQQSALVQVALPLQEARNTISQLLTALLVSVPLLGAAAGLGGYWLATRALAPIDHITKAARQISSEDLSARLNLPATDDEVGRLAQTFDAMLVRLDASFQRERQFTADAAHELRTPLTAMKAILDMMRKRRRTPEDYEQALADLDDENNRLRALSESMLRLISGTDQTHYQKVDLSALLHDVADSLGPAAEAKALKLTADIDEGLAINGDADELVRLFVNLVDNAVKYTQSGSVMISAEQAADHSVRVRVTDTGIGIAAEHLPFIFERFFRVGRSRSLSGAGLGLALATPIARAHDGTLTVQSEVGTGTTFTVCLPSLPAAP